MHFYAAHLRARERGRGGGREEGGREGGRERERHLHAAPLLKRESAGEEGGGDTPRDGVGEVPGLTAEEEEEPERDTGEVERVDHGQLQGARLVFHACGRMGSRQADRGCG